MHALNLVIGSAELARWSSVQKCAYSVRRERGGLKRAALRIRPGRRLRAGGLLLLVTHGMQAMAAALAVESTLAVSSADPGILRRSWGGRLCRVRSRRSEAAPYVLGHSRHGPDDPDPCSMLPHGCGDAAVAHTVSGGGRMRIRIFSLDDAAPAAQRPARGARGRSGESLPARCFSEGPTFQVQMPTRTHDPSRPRLAEAWPGVDPRLAPGLAEAQKSAPHVSRLARSFDVAVTIAGLSRR
jgi:hypothetical protein